MVKTCSKCKVEKSIDEFPLEKRSSGYLYRRNVCKKCRYKQGDIEVRRAKHRRYGKKNRKLISLREKERRKVDIAFHLKKSLRERLRASIKAKCKTGSAIRDLGCSIEELKKHLESNFKPGMSWENKGKWHIDHIRPLSSFNLEDREQFLQACHFSNLQPLWAEENLKKSDKYNDTEIERNCES